MSVTWRTQAARLRFKDVPIERFQDLIGEPLYTNFTTWLRGWKPLEALKSAEMWGSTTSLLPFLKKFSDTRPSPMSGVVRIGEEVRYGDHATSL